MDEMASGVDPDELMDLEEGEGSDLDEEDDESMDDPIPSPFQLPSSGPASAATSAASSPPTTDDVPTHFNFTGKPLSIKRGRGRPRREGGKPLPRRQNSGGSRPRKWKPPGLSRTPKRVKSFDRGDFDFSSITPSPSEEMSMLDPETGALIFPEKEKIMPAPEELPYAPEQWPGKVCGFCNLSERSQLGQGEMLRLICPEGFIPQRVLSERAETPVSSTILEKDAGDKSPRGPVTCRRQKSFNKCRHPSMTSEYVDELTIIGYVEQPVQTLFEQSGHFYVHRNCALWSNGVIRNENSALGNVGAVLLHSSSKKCSHCSHYGASVTCNIEGCTKIFHYPCATASGAFQELSTLSVFCSQHLSHVATLCDSSVCYNCKIMGDIANLMFCSICGEHYHGTCVGLAQLPGVRAGWQCRRCRNCQVCRMTGDESKLMACEQCDKVYHSMCQRPVVTTIPKYGWKCRCCRVCGDCGSRTPGAGLSSRWHAHYTVCDSCYQQRNKGYSCPLCHRAYRAHAHREMVQCTLCRKFVHGTCDPEADLTTYHQRKESHPEYEYVCLNCKNLTQPGRQLLAKRNSMDEANDSMSASQESLYDENTEFDSERPPIEDTTRVIGLGKGKPYSASKIAKKRLGLTTGISGRPKGMGKVIPEKLGFMKRQRLTEFGRKRGPKAKMRGMFGVPGVGLQRPVSDGSKADEEPGVENRLILCSAKDKFILTQDVCVMCGALGTDQEGCLIACVQCGQCYHPYCVNVKVTKVILQKGWRCLDCTVCEGCGQRNDEGRLILCDDCDISYHIYCMDPPLDYVPHGNWKCKWCAICQSCGSTDPGFNCNWMNSFNECGPCASHTACASCQEPYGEGDLIIQCIQCERWLHGMCDLIKTDADAEKCAEEGYNCILCRPRDVPPPHLLPQKPQLKPPTPTKSPEMKSNTSYCVDGVFLSERGHSLIKSLSIEQQMTRKKRKKLPSNLHDKEAGIMATIESVVAGSSADTGLDESAKLEMVDIKEEMQEIYKEGMLWTKEDGPPPEGFTIYTMESGVAVLRRKRQRNLQKAGIGGFLVRVRGIKTGQDNDDVDMLPGQNANDFGDKPAQVPVEGEKPRRKPVRRKPRSKLTESFPPYLQEAFFGRELLECHKEANSSSSDEESKNFHDKDKTIQLSQDEIKAVAAVTKREKSELPGDTKLLKNLSELKKEQFVPKEEEESDTEALKDVLGLPGDLLDTDLVNTIMNEDDDELTKNTDTLESLTDSNLQDDPSESLGNSNNAKDTKDELSDILGTHFNLESIPNINSKDVEDIFKGVLTDESQESQESNVFPMQSSSVFSANNMQPLQHPVNATAVRPTTLPTVNQNNINSPMSFPPQSPYHSEYSNSPQFSPAFSEPPSPWVSVSDQGDMDTAGSIVPSTYNQRSSEKMKADEGLGNGATISAVLYANVNHPEWKTDYPLWSDRYKQIIKKWRTLSTEQRAPFLQKARDNRSALRMKKQQQSQISKESVGSPGVVKPAPAPAPAPIVRVPQVSQPVPVSEVCTHQSRPTSLTTASTSSVSVSPKPASPTIQHQFTVHGQFLGSGDLCHGPAPNVTVNPLYQPPATSPPPRPSAPLPTSAADQQIRVLTPSEIMRTLPSLCQENYDTQPPLDQEKIAHQQKTAREAEQEKQWKQLQALRQQQAQQQQHVIHEQRVQAIAQVQRQMTDPQILGRDQQPNIQVTTSPNLSPSVSPSISTRPFLPTNLKSPPFTTHSPAANIRPPAPPQSPHEVSSSCASPSLEHAKPLDSFVQSPTAQKTPSFQPRLDSAFAQQSRQFIGTRPSLQGITTPPRQEAPDINRQLRDLLQKQQFQKVDHQLLSAKGHQRIWPPTEAAQEQEQPVTSVHNADNTFRHPLPPGIVRPRVPAPPAGLIRQPVQRMQADARLQTLDPRLRLLFQQQRGVAPVNAQQQFQVGSMMRLAQPQSAIRPTNVEQYEELQRQQTAAPSHFQNRAELLNQVRLSQGQQIHRPQALLEQKLPSVAPNAPSETAGNEQEIPDNVTAELEKLEEETGTMVELQGVGDLLGGLADEDDDILAEMGADFNILEYADPELEALTGEKTNILDSLDLVEPEPDKDDKKDKDTKAANLPKAAAPHVVSAADMTKKKEVAAPGHLVAPQVGGLNLNPPPLAVSQSQNVPQNPQHMGGQFPVPAHHQVYQQMLQQVQQAAALGRPMAAGTKLMSPDGITGVVTPNNTISLTLPPNYPHRVLGTPLHLQNKIQMRVGQTSRIVSVGSTAIHGSPVGLGVPPRLNVPPAQPTPPPPPYPGPPPPYPGSTATQMGLHMGPSPMGSHHLPLGLMHPMRPQGIPMPHMQRRPLLLEEQPLLLEELLEQEKREQEKQLQNQSNNSQEEPVSTGGSEAESALLSDHDFEKLKVDVFSSGQLGGLGQTASQASVLPTSTLSVANQNRANFINRLTNTNVGNQWQNAPPRPAPSQTPVQTPPLETVQRPVPTFTPNLQPAPPLPPEHIVTEQDKQAQVVYENWLKYQNSALSQQHKFYETEVQKLRKIRKSLNSKQRQLRKSGNQLTDADAMELQRISTELAILQKHLESSRKQNRQHGMLIQEYQNKQQNKQRIGQGQSPLLMGQQQTNSPLSHPSSSPIHHSSTPQSPMMSPSASPMTQHSSPLNSPGPVVTHSPSHIMQSPNPNMSPVQPSPRIGTPHSQGESSPGPVQSPSQVCPPPPTPRMTSPQHRRLVTSPLGYMGDIRNAGMQGLGQIRFARPPIDSPSQRARMPSPVQGFQQKPGTPSPLSSPPPQHLNVTQQLLQKQIQQSFGQQNMESGQSDANIVNSQRAVQLLQQRQLIMRQQQLAQQQQHNTQVAQQQSLTPQQHHLLLQRELAKQQQLAQMQAAQNRLNQQQNNPTSSSPLPPKSPLISQVQNLMSPHSVHSQPPSPMPPRSPMVNFNTANQPPSSPMPRSPAVQGNQPPSSPMMHSQHSPMPRSPMLGQIQSPIAMRRPPSTSSSPAMPDRPTSVENPGTPRYSSADSQFSMMENDHTGGGNPHNPNNPIPFPPGFGRFGYFKLGLRGGSPMWSYGRGVKRIPNAETKDEEKSESNTNAQPKLKKESHLSKVSILKKKSPIKTNLQSYAISKVGSLVSTDYNEFDDSSSTPPVTPPPVPSTSKLVIQKHEKRFAEQQEQITSATSSPENKQMHDEMMDYDDDNDNTVVSTEVSLSSAAQQNDGDDITVIETFSGDLTDVMSSPLESDQIAEEFVLFPGNMVVDISGEAHYSDKDEEDEEYSGQLVNIHDKNMHIVNVAIQSPTTSEEEMIMQGKTKNVTSDGLTLNIVQGLSSSHHHLLTMTDTPESPDQEELHIDPSPESGEEELLSNFEDSEIVIIDPSVKSPEEQISTKEDFEELIDEGTKKEKIIKSDILNNKHISEIHKYTSNVYSFQQKTTTSANAQQYSNNSNIKTSACQKLSTTSISTQNISYVASPVKTVTTAQKVITKATDLTNRNTKIINTSTSPITSIILPIKTTVRSNIISVPKLVTSVSPAITIVSASTSQIASILPAHFTVPVISASAVSKLTNVKVIDKPSSSLSLTTHDTSLPKKIFEDEPLSPDSSHSENDKTKEMLIKREKIEEKQAADVEEKREVLQEHPTTIKIVNEAVKISSSQETAVIQNKRDSPLRRESPKTLEPVKENNAPESKSTAENLITSNLKDKSHISISNAAQSVLIHNTPELKMTAQIIQEHIAGRSDGTMPASFITSQNIDDSNSNDLDSKSVVISIPSPTPSQEQMLDNIALQALENRRRDGSGISGEFESFEDVLDMIENITGEPPTVLEDNIKDKLKLEEPTAPQETVVKKLETQTVVVEKKEPENKPTETKREPTAIATAISTSISQLSPLLQPNELTTNMANVSQQLRTLLSTSPSVETVVKNVPQREKVVTSTITPQTSSSPPVPKVIQQVEKTSPTVTSSTVIVPNFRMKTPTPPAVNSPKTFSPAVAFPTSSPTLVSTSTASSSTHTISYLPTPISNLTGRSMGGIQLMPDHPKLPPITTVSNLVQSTNSPVIVQTNVSAVKASVISSSVNTSPSLSSSKSLSLNAMLQSHPAATTPQTAPSTITTASLLGSPLGIIRSGFSTNLVQSHPHVSTSNQPVSNSSGNSVSSNSSTVMPVVSRPIVSTTNLLHTQLMKSVKVAPNEEQSSSEVIIKREDIKQEVSEVQTSVSSQSIQSVHNVLNFSRADTLVGCKLSNMSTPTANRMEDSQNVLLKQLLQNTACASTTVTSVVTTTITSTPSSTPSTPTLPLVPNLEEQLARPVPPTPTSLLPPILQNEPQTNTIKATQRNTIMSRETSFVSKPVIQQAPPSTVVPSMPSQQLHIDTKKCLPPSRTPSRDDLLSPPTPRSTGSQDSSLQTPPLTVKKEAVVAPPNMLLPQEVKKELVDESSQHSEISDHSKPDIQMKEEMMELDPSTEKSLLEQKEEIKKMKRRAYQQKRRMNQMLGKETTGQPKKRPRKSSKVEEDYDAYIDSVLAQLRNLPPMNVAEPILNRNFSVVPIFGTGDAIKLGGKDYDSRCGDLVGTYGNAVLPDISDYYNTQPYGDLDPLPEKTPASTQRGFYDQEFTLIKFDTDEDKKFDLFCREDTPDSIISSSSPECPVLESPVKFPGLRLISEDEDEEEVTAKMRLSPVVPLIAPIPIRLKSSGPYLKDSAEIDKENVEADSLNLKSKFESKPSTPLKDSGNVTVTLTLTSSAAEDIMGVLRDLANILHIPAPTSYQIVERTSTPPSQKLGLYRTKGKDGREGAPIDIQSILNGAAKFCRHCDVVILNNMIRKKVSDLPCLSKDTDLLDEDEDLFFCGSTCFMQFALMHRSPSISDDKAAAIIDHLCQKDKAELKSRKISEQFASYEQKKLDNLDLDIKEYRKDYKMEPMDMKFEKHMTGNSEDYMRLSKKSFDKALAATSTKSHRGTRYKIYTAGCVQAASKCKKLSDKEIMELLYRMNITVSPARPSEDTRKCMFCHLVGDGVPDGPARLLNFDVDKWVHLNCGLWSDGVYETVNGALMNLENALQQSLVSTCVHCNQSGATIRCFKTRCSNNYHLGCAVKDNCVFYKNKTTYCSQHVPKGEKDNELTTLAVSRRVYVNRDENRQVAAVMHHSDTNNLLRVGSLIFLSVGQLLPHQLQNFHTSNYIYPIGYKIIRFYWSMRRLNRRCRYICSIHEVSGRPEFRVVVQETDETDVELRDHTPKGVWIKILEALAALRRDNQCIQVFPKFVSGEDLFGLTEPAVVRVLESLPGIETLTDYKFKYGRNPLLELPLAINPSGAARTEPRLRNQLHWKRPHTQRTGSSARPVFASSVTGVAAGETACPYSKQFVHSKSSQYKKMKQEWRNNVYLARSKIQGLGLYAARDLEKHTMVIEYIGEIIRTELAETREKKYEAKNRGIYMFRLDEERVVDATLSGGLARYINHSCNPNCVAEIVEVDRDLRIIIFAKRRIQRGEELAYDYKFDIEDDQHKISCMCGAPNCRKWMN